MFTRIVLAIQDPDGESSWVVDLEDSFDTVFDKMFPINPPSSNLEHRVNMFHTMTNGQRIAISPHHIIAVYECEDEEDD